MIPLVDTHIHLDAPELRGAGINLPAEARRQGIDTFVIPGVQLGGWQRLVDLAEQATGVYAAPGLHPAYAGQWSAQAV
ncbi:MAG: TatD family deoxyribonuclease, partial [Desulfuromonadaceae bacterium]|nr:TatD family deoxyribonuclease [Desulfuromonadaceae bacterium]